MLIYELLLLEIILSGLKSVKNVKYLAFSARPPALASICNIYINAGMPAPNQMLYFVSEKKQEKIKHILPINK